MARKYKSIKATKPKNTPWKRGFMTPKQYREFVETGKTTPIAQQGLHVFGKPIWTNGPNADHWRENNSLA